LLPPAAVPVASADALRGIVMMVLAVFLFTCMDAVVKWVGQTYPVGQIVFFRNLFAFLPILYFVSRTGGIAVLRTTQLGGHMLRGLVGVAAMACFFGAYTLLPLGDAVAIGMSGPIFMTAFSVPLLGEAVGLRRWSAVAVGFAGVLLMTRPGVGSLAPGALLALSGAVFYALAMILIRKLSRSEHPTTIVFYFTVFATLAGAVSLPFGQWITPATLLDLGLLVAVGLIGGFAQFAMTHAFRLAPVAIVAPFDYLALVFAMALGYAIWDELPDAWILSGAAVVVASGLYILHRETVLARRRRAARAADQETR
jgi:drug/metabolite transporter (DMT)-like permease